MAKLFFYDTETTGTDYRTNAIHQISGLLDLGEQTEAFDFRLRPYDSAAIDTRALEVSGVSMEQINAYPPMGVAYRSLIELLSKHCDKFNKADKFHLIGYNNRSFDDQFLRQLWFLMGDRYFGSWFWADSIDVMVLASDRLRDERHTLPDFKLHTVATHMGIELDETKLHNAAYDIEITRKLYYALHKDRMED